MLELMYIVHFARWKVYGTEIPSQCWITSKCNLFLSLSRSGGICPGVVDGQYGELAVCLVLGIGYFVM